jgi:hypothetical protein
VMKYGGQIGGDAILVLLNKPRTIEKELEKERPRELRFTWETWRNRGVTRERIKEINKIKKLKIIF